VFVASTAVSGLDPFRVASPIKLLPSWKNTVPVGSGEVTPGGGVTVAVNVAEPFGLGETDRLVVVAGALQEMITSPLVRLPAVPKVGVPVAEGSAYDDPAAPPPPPPPLAVPPPPPPPPRYPPPPPPPAPPPDSVAALAPI
jgi:hypothetical protein